MRYSAAGEKKRISEFVVEYYKENKIHANKLVVEAIGKVTNPSLFTSYSILIILLHRRFGVPLKLRNNIGVTFRISLLCLLLILRVGLLGKKLFLRLRRRNLMRNIAENLVEDFDIFLVLVDFRYFRRFFIFY